MLTQYLENCNRFITLDPVERSVFAEHYDRIRDYVIDTMKSEDILFNQTFHHTQLSGSYADQLKISKPDEYDVLMILKIPDLVVEQLVHIPGYVQIRTNWEWNGIERILDGDGYLMQNKVFVWLREIMKKVFPNQRNQLTIEGNHYIISRKVSGPANTLKIQCGEHSNDTFSVDFVGALEFSVTEVWMADDNLPRQRFRNYHWNAVPKPRKPTRRPPQFVNGNTFRRRQTRNPNPNKNRNWICSYAAIERDLIHDSQFIKPLIRIFKKIRDTQELTNLKSYYIKQIFIYERMKQEPSYWERPLGELFHDMLNVIIKWMCRGDLPFFWHKDLNLFKSFSWDQIVDIKRKFKRIKRDIFYTRGSDYIYNVILTVDELDSRSYIDLRRNDYQN